MEDVKLTAKETLSIFEEVESQLEKLLLKRRQEIEYDLSEKIRLEREEAEKKIRREQEEADKKIGQIEDEFSKGRAILSDYKSVISDYENERLQLQNEIRAHFDKAMQFQTEIEHLASLTLEELRLVSELNLKLENLHQNTEERAVLMRKDLEEKFGIVAQAPETPEVEEIKVDLSNELLRLKKIKELLEAEGLKASEDLAKVQQAAPLEPLPLEEKAEKPVPVPELDELIASTLSPEETQAPAEAEDLKAAAGEDNFKALFDKLEKYRRVSTEGNNGEICYFQNETRFVLDGEGIITGMADTLEETKKLFVKLIQADSPKEVFFIKQDIINHQESLRKFILRVVKLCEREGFLLPRFTQDLLHVQLLKDILERLSIENWSNEADFTSFAAFAESLKDEYYAKITPPVVYLKSLVEELGIS